MGAPTEYQAFSICLSIVLVLTFSLHLYISAVDFHTYHDERAATKLMLSIAKVIVSAGLLVSALGIPMDNATMALAGLSMARGALLVAGLTLLFVDIQNRR